MSVKRYDFDCYAFYDSARLTANECEDGDYVLYSDYAALLARHNALREAVEWERECEDLVNYLNAKDSRVWLAQRSSWLRSIKAARAEVDRLLKEPTP